MIHSPRALWHQRQRFLPAVLVVAFGRRWGLVGRVHGLQGLGAAYLFCSLETARILCRGIRRDEVSFLLVRCRDADDAGRLARRLREQYHMAVFTRDEFST